jgi:hypothetical protein
LYLPDPPLWRTSLCNGNVHFQVQLGLQPLLYCLVMRLMKSVIPK